MIKNRNQQMDVLRGIGIILVVLGHTAFPANHFIYLFHLAIFFMLSGYFFKSEEITNTRNLKQYILKKIKRLYFPYIIANVVCVILNNFFLKTNMYSISTHYYFSIKDIIINIIKILVLNGTTEMVGATWFLPILFEITILYGAIEFLIIKIRKKEDNKIQTLISISLLILGYFLATNNIELKFIKIPVFTCYVLFDFGRKFKKYKKEQNNFIKLFLLISSLILLVILNNFGTIEISKNIYTNLIFYISVSIIGWFFIYELSYIFSKINIIKKIFSYIGQNTMPILILHFLIFKVVNLIGILSTKKDIMLLATFPVAFKEKYWWIIYTLFGTFIPILINKIQKIIVERKKNEVRSSNSNL